MADSVEIRAISKSKKFFEKNGWAVSIVSRIRGKHYGYDLLIEKDSKQLKIEVKGSTWPYHGIPDLYDTQVDQNKGLVADYLIVWYFPPSGLEKQAIIPRDHFPSDAFDTCTHYRVKAKYRNLAAISEHLIDINEPGSAKARSRESHQMIVAS